MMPAGRPARPWYRKGRGMCITHEGKKVLLVPGPDTSENRAKADDIWQQMLDEAGERLARSKAHLRPPPPPSPPGAVATGMIDPGPGRSLAALIAGYLAYQEQRHAVGLLSTSALRDYRFALARLDRCFPGRSAASVTADELERWVARPEWSSSTRHYHLCVVLQLFNWGRITLDRALTLPPKESRGTSCLLTDEQFAKVLAELTRSYQSRACDLAALLRVLRETGARPGEIAALTVEAVNWDHGCVRLKQHKTVRKSGEPRLLTFTAAAMDVLREQRARHPTGLLFRTNAGLRYGPVTISRQLGTISRRVGFRVIAYSLRHEFATRALMAGIPDTIVASLLGHTSTAMIHKHYSHVSQQAQALRAAAEQISKANQK